MNEIYLIYQLRWAAIYILLKNKRFTASTTCFIRHAEILASSVDPFDGGAGLVSSSESNQLYTVYVIIWP